MRLKKSAVAVLATASLLALAACGGGADDDNPDDVVPTQEAGGGAGAGKDPTLEGPRAVPEDAAQGGTVTVLTAGVPVHLRPHPGLLHRTRPRS